MQEAFVHFFLRSFFFRKEFVEQLTRPIISLNVEFPNDRNHLVLFIRLPERERASDKSIKKKCEKFQMPKHRYVWIFHVYDA